MKYSKLIATALLASAFVFGPNASADEKKEKKPAAAKKVKKGRPLPGALGKLELSADDKKAVGELLKDVYAKRKEAGKNRELQAEIRKDYLDKLGEILGEKKMAEFKKLNAEMAKNRKKGAKNAGSKKGKNPNKKKSDK